MTHLVQFNAANGATPTLNVNSLGATPLHILKPAGWGAMPAATVIDGMICRVVYNSSAGAYRVVSGPQTAVVSGSSGYTVGPNSTRRQWSSVEVGAGGAAGINFPVAFSASPYSVVLTPNGNPGSSPPPWVTTVASASFTLVNPSSNTIFYYWVAEGPA